MVEVLLTVIRQSLEYQAWGWNAITIGSLGVLFFGLMEGWGLWKQSQTIWKSRSGESLSIRWFAYIGAYLGATVVYGLEHKSVALVIGAGIGALMHIPIVYGIAKFKTLGMGEKSQSILFLLMISAMTFFEDKELIYTLLSFGSIYAVGTQAWELYKTKQVGAVDIRLIIVYGLSGGFWLTFAFSTEALALMLTTPAVLALLLLTGGLWVYYRQKE